MGTVAFGENEVNEVPEPATVVLLVSGLGYMGGILKKRRRTVAREIIVSHSFDEGCLE
jgi:hypothetical protein